jgi:hypothetical protein
LKGGGDDNLTVPLAGGAIAIIYSRIEEEEAVRYMYVLYLIVKYNLAI